MAFSDFYGIFVANEILQHCTFLIIAHLTGLLLDFSFHYNSQNGSHHLNMNVFIHIGQRGFHLRKKMELLRKIALLYGCQIGPN